MGSPPVARRGAEPAEELEALVPSTVVVPLDGSDFSLRALPFASWLAERVHADLFAMTTPQSIDDAHRLDTPVWLSALRSAGYPHFTDAVIDDEDPARAVARVVAMRSRSAVCMATHARGVLGSIALGNICERVLRSVDVPVLLVGRHCADRPNADGPVVVCHDGSPAADAIVAPARAWALVAGLALVVVNVHPTGAGSTGAMEAVEPALDALGPGTSLELVTGSFPAGAIRDVAHELDASMIAMSTHGRTGAARVAMGSVASWVTRESMCPVLTVRPSELER